MKHNIVITIIAVCVVSACNTAAQTWKEDSLVIRHILDTNGLYSVEVDSVVVYKDSSGRAKTVFFRDLPEFHIIPASIKKLTRLIHLQIERTGLASIPPEIGDLGLLKVLNITSNSHKLSTLPPEIGNLKSLISLDLSHCDNLTLPSEIGNLDSLKILRVKFCNLTELPDEICNLKSLESLDLMCNKLTTLPEDFGNLTALEQVFLHYNDLRTLPQSMVNLSVRPDLFDVCYNDSLVFTAEQCDWYQIKDYKDYFKRYCYTEIAHEEESVSAASAVIAVQVGIRSVSVTAPYGGYMHAAVYTSNGRKVETLFSANLAVVPQVFVWDRTGYLPGVYYLQVRFGTVKMTRKIMVLR